MKDFPEYVDVWIGLYANGGSGYLVWVDSGLRYGYDNFARGEPSLSMVSGKHKQTNKILNEHNFESTCGLAEKCARHMITRTSILRVQAPL